ncbi:GGDEF domain-containing protein [Solimonas variicoloris]|uniref:GGDEF domain-containing protein n=1 Tax=Solimonas variicoloris TaxID=254408 RepID=UPI0012B510ED|nr:GGDEF domain-containing protein [Solimonas variicoloris]
MLLDARTLYLEMFAICVVLGVAELVFYLRRPQSHGVGWWALANLGAALGTLLIGLRGHVPAIWSIAVANTVAVAAVAVAWFGLLAYDRRPLPIRAAALPVLALFAVLAIPSPLSADLAARIVIVGCALAGFEAAAAAAAVRIARRDGSIAAWICAFLMALCTLVNLARAVVVLRYGAGDDYMGHNALHAFLLFLLVPAYAGWNMSLMMMSMERTQRSLARAARTDAMTGALNREGFREQAEIRVRAARQAGRPLVMALVDLDHFKLINDRGGHAAGDAALCRFAQIAAVQLRGRDLLGRYGGDEFAMLLEDIDAAQAERVAARLCQRFSEAMRGVIDGASPTLSIGVAVLEPDMTLDMLVALADVALYRAKAGGRNGVALVRDLQALGATVPPACPAPRRDGEALLFD